MPSNNILLVDNYDSFTHNLAQGLGMAGGEVTVWRNDAFTLADVDALQPSHVVISPGPGRPEDAGRTEEVVQHCLGRVPLLGVCLGHQALIRVLGGTIGRASVPMHGKTSPITHDGTGLFTGVTDPMTVGRYHSLLATTVPEGVEITARSAAGEVMAVRVPGQRAYGVQFHPESILSPEGQRLLANFVHPTITVEVQAPASPAQIDAVRPIIRQVLPRVEHLSARLDHLTVAYDGPDVVGFKLGGRDGMRFESAFGAVLPPWRRLGIARKLLRAQHAHLAGLLRDGGSIRTSTQNCFRPMLRLNLQQGFRIVGVTVFGRDQPNIELERTLSSTPSLVGPVRFEVGGTAMAMADPCAAQALIALLDEGYDVVGTCVAPGGERVVLSRTEPGYGPDTFVR